MLIGLPSRRAANPSDALSLRAVGRSGSIFDHTAGMNLLARRSSSKLPSRDLPERGVDRGGPADSASPIPDELNPRRLRRRLLALAAVGVFIGVVVLTGPGLGGLRTQVARASPGWLVLGVGLKVLSALSYVVIFRAVFCPRMSWRLSYQIGMAEQAANSVLSWVGSRGVRAADDDRALALRVCAG